MVFYMVTSGSMLKLNSTADYNPTGNEQRIPFLPPDGSPGAFIREVGSREDRTLGNPPN